MITEERGLVEGEDPVGSTLLIWFLGGFKGLNLIQMASHDCPMESRSLGICPQNPTPHSLRCASRLGGSLGGAVHPCWAGWSSVPRNHRSQLQ